MKHLSAFEILTQLNSRQTTSEAVVEGYIERVKQYDGALNSFVKMNKSALGEARAIDELRAKNKSVGKLAGLPIAVKDLFCTKGIETSAGSKILKNFIPPYTATCVKRLQDEGAIILGKTNMDEFAMGSSNENSFEGIVHNPWGKEYVPGGSSGGSAAAVAAGLAPVALGSDTGGSIRQPASFCGITGIKPTYGRISRFGMVSFASSLDQAGPMAKSVKDCALLLEIMSGHDEWDATSSQKPVSALSQLGAQNLQGCKVGIPSEYFSDEVSESVRECFEATTSKLKAAGAEMISISLPHTNFAIAVYYLVATSEASSNLSRYDGIRYGYRAEEPQGEKLDLEELYLRTRSEGFGEEVKRRILLGTFALSSGFYDAYYKKACQVRRLIQNDFIEAFKKCDVLISPVTTDPAFKIGEKILDPIKMYLNDIFTTPASLAGIPAMSLPMGLSKNKMPIGLQVLAPHFHEEALVQYGLAFENLLPGIGEPDGF